MGDTATFKRRMLWTNPRTGVFPADGCLRFDFYLPDFTTHQATQQASTTDSFLQTDYLSRYSVSWYEIY